MAVIKAISSRATVSKIHDYLTNEEKTEEKLISGVNCNPDNMVNEFNTTKELYNKNGGVQYQHIIQSFDPKDNITPDKAHELGKELAEKRFKGYEVFVVTHKDKEHIHNHFVVNSVNYENGLKYQASNKSLWDIKRESNRICEREHLKTLDLEHKANERLTSGELRKELRGETTWKGELKECIKLAKEKTKSLEEFRVYLKENFDIETRITKKSISYQHPEKEKPIRGKKLGNDYDKEELEHGFIRKEKSINREGNRGKESITGAGGIVKGDNQKIVRDRSNIEESIFFSTNGESKVSSIGNDKSVSINKTEQRETGKVNRAVGGREESTRGEQKTEYRENQQDTSWVKGRNEGIKRNELSEDRGNNQSSAEVTRDNRRDIHEVSGDITRSQQHGESDNMERESKTILNSTSDNNRIDIDDNRSLSSSDLLDQIVESFAEPLKMEEEREKERKALADIEEKAREKQKLQLEQKSRFRNKSKDFGMDR